jgi:hypothetical protein
MLSKNIIKLNIIKNAMEKGWRVEKKDENTFVLTKKIDKINNQEKSTDKIIDSILDIRKFDNFDNFIENYYTL